MFDRHKCVAISISPPHYILASGARDKGNNLCSLMSFPSNLEVNSLEDIESMTRTWHERLGHISYQSFVNLIRMSTGISLLKTKPRVCEICQKDTSVPSEISSRVFI